MSTERWKDVVGYEGVYQVSDMGGVKRMAGYSCIVGRILKHIVDSTGYPKVFLSVNGKQKYVYVHRLVLEAFVGLRPSGLECCHNDGNKLNPKLDNLRWDTRSANQLDSVKHGTKNNGNQRGSSNPNSKINTEKVILIRKHIKENVLTNKQIAKMFDISPQTVCSIKKERRWGWLK